MQKLELLSPAKNLETALCAINHGADAIYIGAENFGARTGAKNNLSDIKKLIDFAHLFNVKVYVTINTILDDNEVKQQIDKIFKSIFNVENPFSLKELEQEALDALLIAPHQAIDSTTSQPTWSIDTKSEKYITQSNMQQYDAQEGWMKSPSTLSSVDEILSAWKNVNFCATERFQESLNAINSDLIYSCENVYRSSNCRASKNLFFCDNCGDCEYLFASQRSGSCNFSICVDDSVYCSNSYQIDYCNKVANSYFIRDCFDLYECMFCAHIASRRFCIATMQFSEEDYYALKPKVINWILKGKFLRPAF